MTLLLHLNIWAICPPPTQLTMSPQLRVLGHFTGNTTSFEMTISLTSNFAAICDFIENIMTILQTSSLKLRLGGGNKNKRRFFKKKHSCGFILFSKLCYAPIFLIHFFHQLKSFKHEGN